jgi:DNA-binding LytR/AlgR family response regulator
MVNQDSVILIVEDDPTFANLLQILLGQLNFMQVFHATNYDSALQLMATKSIDLFLIDITLSESKSGIQLAEEIRLQQRRVPIIYLTANYTDDYYTLARHTRPSSFINKELSKLKLHQAIDLALLSQHTVEKNITLAGNHVPPHISEHNLYFRIGDSFKAFPIKEVAYFYSDKKMTYAKIGTRSYPTSVQLKTLEEELSSGDFVRIHKSYIVNTRQIEAIHPGESTVSINNESLPIGNAYRKEFMSILRLLK